MRLGSILSEAWRNILTGTARVAILAGVLAFTAGVTAAADVATVFNINDDARAYISAGGATRYILGEDSISATSCTALRSYQNVTAVGALRAAPDVAIDALGGASFLAYETTPGFAPLLGLPRGSSGVWVSQGLAETLGVREGSTFSSNGEEMRVGGVFSYPDDGRDARLAYAILVPTAPEGSFDECWSRAWPESPETEGQLRSALRIDTPTGTEISVSQMNRSLGTSFDGNTQYNERLTRWSPHLAGIAALLIGFISVRLRRLEYSSARHAGQSRLAQTVTIALETLAWATLGVSLAGATIYLTTGMLIPGDMDWIPTLLLTPLISSATCTLLGALLGTLVIRESDLFKIFKAR